MMRRFTIFLVSCFMAAALMAVSGRESPATGVDQCVNRFKAGSKLFSTSTFRLLTAIKQIEKTDTGSVLAARAALVDCRLSYKSLESFLEYFFPTAAVTYNGPARVEVEEPNLDYTEGVGLQVIEALLFEKDVYARKKELLLQMEVITSSAEDIHALLFNFKGDEGQLLESLRLELIRVMTLGISGFDAPLLKSGIRESYVALLSINDALQPFLQKGDRSPDSLSFYLHDALGFLRRNTDFDSFDRLQFLTDYALPLQYQLGKWIRQTGKELNSTAVLNYDADNLFSPDFFRSNAFSAAAASNNPAIGRLGEKLFSEAALSGNGLKSCASCHSPSMFYTDGLAKSRAFNEHRSLTRNAPSVLYSAFQYSQGWDGGVKSLEDQVIKVLESPEEMNAGKEALLQRLENSPGYPQLFEVAFGKSGGKPVSLGNIAYAIAEFLRSCNPFNAPFDHYLRGNRAALSPEQKKGFNLFMGKAQCGSCHFAPLFSGLTPPLYNRSEVEVIGVPGTGELDQPQYDADRGRYNIYPVRFYDKAFKTPGLRNSARTAPYMHNGSFTTLKQVVDFYNRGGSEGIGLKLPNQTLSARPLKLTQPEITAVMRFMEALTDSIPARRTIEKY